jgi:hypothetical protein
LEIRQEQAVSKGRLRRRIRSKVAKRGELKLDTHRLCALADRQA